jgi:hypothetical protein
MYMVICISCFEIRLGRYSRGADWQWLNSLRYRDMSSDNYIHEKKKQPQKRMACHLSDLDPTKEWFRTRPPPRLERHGVPRLS